MNETPGRTDFTSQIGDAYRHLYDLVYLRTYTLAEVLVTDPMLSPRERAWRLHHLLLEAIDELDPGPHAPVYSREWRRFRLMDLRYRDGLNPREVAHELAISRRHYYREHEIALRRIADTLWEQCAVQPLTTQPMSKVSTGQVSSNRLEFLRLETARVADADRYAHVDDVLEQLLSLLSEVLRQRELEVHLAMPKTLPAVFISRGLLRQVLLGTLGYLIECAQQAAIRLTGRVEEPAVCLSMMVEPRSAARPSMQVSSEERLSTLQEMAALGGITVQPLLGQHSIIGFDMRLSTVQHTVVIVDDNRDMLELFRRYLGSHYYHVVTTQFPKDALDLVRRLQPYAIIVDLMMPYQDGWDLLQALLGDPDTCHVPVVVCTVLRQKELALSLGAAAFLEKPVTQQELLVALEALRRE